MQRQKRNHARVSSRGNVGADSGSALVSLGAIAREIARIETNAGRKRPRLIRENPAGSLELRNERKRL